MKILIVEPEPFYIYDTVRPLIPEIFQKNDTRQTLTDCLSRLRAPYSFQIIGNGTHILIVDHFHNNHELSLEDFDLVYVKSESALNRIATKN